MKDLPLIDLHLHLDGAISYQSARELAALQGMPVLSDDEMRGIMTVNDGPMCLSDFLLKIDYPCSLIQTEATLTKAVNNLLHELREQGVAYAEIRFAPQKSRERGLTTEEVVVAALKGLDDNVVPARLVLCCMRGRKDEVYEANLETIALTKKYLGKGVVATDLAGAEALYPTTDYADLFAYARGLGVPFTIHSGEAEGVMSGLESIQAAIDMGANVLGHGVLSYRSEEMLTQLAERGVALTLCPTSNLCTEIFKDISEYPILTFLKHGVKVCINTDDPVTEGTTLRREYELLKETFHLDDGQIRQLLLNAVEMSYAEQELKDRLYDLLNLRV